MSRYELSINPDYVTDWGLNEALRELLQNAIDESRTSGGDYTIDYDEDSQLMSISNVGSSLERSSLLLGQSSKRNDDSTIGKFGEGYKLALIVLIRSGKSISINNYGKKEVWNPSFIKSRRYGTEIMVVDINKVSSFWRTIPNKDLTIDIWGITKDEYEEFMNQNLETNPVDPSDIHHTEYGSIITDESRKGIIYINGLYIGKLDKLKYGYDLNSSDIRIGRDRNLVDTDEVLTSTSKVLLATDSISKEDKSSLLLTNYYIDFSKAGYIFKYDLQGSIEELSEYLVTTKLGPNGYFSTSYTDDIPEYLRKSLKNTVLSYSTYSMVRDSKCYKSHVASITKELGNTNYVKMYNDWKIKASEFMYEEDLEKLDYIVSKLSGTSIDDLTYDYEESDAELSTISTSIDNSDEDLPF